MEKHIIKASFSPQPKALLDRLSLSPDSDEAADFLDILEKVAPLAKPTAALLEVAVGKAEGDTISLGGIGFTSPLLVKHLQNEKTAWPFLASCGREMYDYAMSLSDPFERFWVDEIMQEALTAVVDDVEQFFGDQVFKGKTGIMSPGSLVDWPIEQQIPLFELLGVAASECGVTLTETLLMLPNKSISGIRFHDENGFVSCSRCPRIACPKRRALYDPEAALAT